MKKAVFFITTLFLILSCSNSDSDQNVLSDSTNESIKRIDLLEGDFGCSYSGSMGAGSIYLFNSNDDAEKVIQDIMLHTGLVDNFVIKAADVDNACALIKNDTRYIFYNQLFIQNVKKRTNSDYGAISILAHEIGHHLNGHTFLNLKKQDRIQLELEADRFSGFILAKHGASLDEALKAIKVFGSKKESETHPAQKTRIAAITNGYQEAMNLNPDEIKNEKIVEKNKTFYLEIDKPPLAMRNKSLNPEEIQIAQSGNAEAKKINRETIIADLPNGTKVEVLSQVNNTFYVKAWHNNSVITGYIVKKFRGKSTIRE